MSKLRESEAEDMKVLESTDYTYIIENIVSVSKKTSLLSLPLGLDEVDELVPFGVGPLVGAESLLSKFKGFLFSSRNASLDHFNHSLLVGGESGNFLDDFSHELDSLVQSALLVNRSVVPGVSFGLGDLMSLVKYRGDASSSHTRLIFNK